MSKFNSFVDAFGRIRSHKRRRRSRVSSVASLLRDQWREESDRKIIETVGIIFSVKLIGLDVVSGAYDELGCQRTLRKWRRSKRGRRGYHNYSSSPVLLSVSSTSVKIIQHHWVVAFEHAVTAISTCYTDLKRPRLFAYIVKDYTTGSHFCLAFKTMKKSGISGKRLQKAFGYAFDSCCTSPPPPLLSPERNSLAELEQCLQTNSEGHQCRGVMKSNSNFSASLVRVFSPAPSSPLYQPIDVSTTTHTPHGHSNNPQCEDDKQEDDPTMARDRADISPASATSDRDRGENVERFVNLAKVNATHCCYNCHQSRKRISRSFSDSFLHQTRQSLQLKPLRDHEKNMPVGNTPATPGEASDNRDVTLIDWKNEVHVHRNQPGEYRDESPSVSIASEDMNHLHKECSMSSNISDSGVIILLAPSLHDPKLERNAEQNGAHLGTERHVSSQTQIERQVGYLNLPTHSSQLSNNTPLEPPTLHSLINHTAGFDITSSEIKSGTVLQMKQPNSVALKEISPALDKEQFITELTTKLAKLELVGNEDSIKKMVDLVPSEQPDCPSHSFSPVVVESTPPTPPPRRESLHPDTSAQLEPAAVPENNVSSQLSVLAGSSDDIKPPNTAQSATYTTPETCLHPTTQPTSDSTSPEQLQSVAKSKAISDQSGTSFRMVNGATSVCGSCSQCMSAHEAQAQISRILNMVCSPLQATCSTDTSGENGARGKTRTVTCFIATWERGTENLDNATAY